MKYLLLLLLLLLLPGVFFGQELHHQMISSQGNTSQLSNGMVVRATVGQSITGNSGQVQQGFQQSYWSSYISKNEQSANDVKVITFPNPFIDLVNFRFSGEIGSEVDISIFDIMGRMIVSRKINVIDNQVSIDLGNLAKAEYLVRISSGSFKYYLKIIKKTL